MPKTTFRVDPAVVQIPLPALEKKRQRVIILVQVSRTGLPVNIPPCGGM